LFVGAQVALAMIVLAGAALLVQSVRRLIGVSPGFTVENLLTLRLALTTDQYPAIEAAVATHDQLLERLAAIPGVRGAGSITYLPLTGRSNTGTMTIAGTAAGGSEPSAAIRTVSPGYFRAMGIPLIAGRELTAFDRATATPVVLVNRTLAEQVFGGHPIGKQIRFPFLDPSWEIVGIVGDERFEDLDRPVMPAVYFPPAQVPSRGFSVVLRTAVAPLSLVDEVSAAVAAINPRLPVGDVMTMEELRAATGPVWIRRYVLSLVTGFAMLALLLSAIGVYGVVGQGVADRRREFGIRLALGATRREVMTLVVRQGAVPVAAGVCAGLCGAVLIKRPLATFLFRPEIGDAAIVVAAALALAAIAVLACVIPSRRAARTDPAVTLRG
jgi:putative ABC transport system permease protein